MTRVLLLNKPFGVQCKFTDAEGRPTLASYVRVRDVYAAGRLDADSEGLVVLTDDGALQHLLTDPRRKVEKTYWAQVEGVPDESALGKLRAGVALADGTTRPADARVIDAPSRIWERSPPIRFRKNVPTAWIEITIGEGRNRQVRRMTAAVGHPTLRLVRVRVGPWTLGTLKPGEWSEASVPGALRERGPRRAPSSERAARAGSREDDAAPVVPGPSSPKRRGGATGRDQNRRGPVRRRRRGPA